MSVPVGSDNVSNLGCAEVLAGSGVAIADAPPKGLFYVPYLGDSSGACRTGTFSPGFATPKYVALVAGLVDAATVESDPAPLGGRFRFAVRLGPGAIRVRSSMLESEKNQDPSPRGEIVEWSPSSRLRMVETMATLDWGPVVEPERPGWRPAMVTLTMPGKWEELAPDGPAFKAIMGRFRRRWEREWGEFAMVWKLEFQRRGAPHLHIYAACGSDQAFKEWVSIAWTCSIFGLRFNLREGETFAQLVTRCRETYGEEVARSLAAGAGVDWGEGIRASDPKRLAVYFLKRATGHNLGADKEYQHRVPELWRDAVAGPGRFWGYRGLVKATEEVPIYLEHFVALRRLLRRWAKSNGRPVPWLGSSRMAGGMVLANDAPGLLAQAVRFLATLEVDYEQRTVPARAATHGPPPRDLGAT